MLSHNIQQNSTISENYSKDNPNRIKKIDLRKIEIIELLQSCLKWGNHTSLYNKIEPFLKINAIEDSNKFYTLSPLVALGCTISKELEEFIDIILAGTPLLVTEKKLIQPNLKKYKNEPIHSNEYISGINITKGIVILGLDLRYKLYKLLTTNLQMKDIISLLNEINTALNISNNMKINLSIVQIKVLVSYCKQWINTATFAIVFHVLNSVAINVEKISSPCNELLEIIETCGLVFKSYAPLTVQTAQIIESNIRLTRILWILHGFWWILSLSKKTNHININIENKNFWEFRNNENKTLELDLLGIEINIQNCPWVESLLNHSTLLQLLHLTKRFHSIVFREIERGVIQEQLIDSIVQEQQILCVVLEHYRLSPIVPGGFRIGSIESPERKWNHAINASTHSQVLDSTYGYSIFYALIDTICVTRSKLRKILLVPEFVPIPLSASDIIGFFEYAETISEAHTIYVDEIRNIVSSTLQNFSDNNSYLILANSKDVIAIYNCSNEKVALSEFGKENVSSYKKAEATSNWPFKISGLTDISYVEPRENIDIDFVSNISNISPTQNWMSTQRYIKQCFQNITATLTELVIPELSKESNSSEAYAVILGCASDSNRLSFAITSIFETLQSRYKELLLLGFNPWTYVPQKSNLKSTIWKSVINCNCVMFLGDNVSLYDLALYYSEWLEIKKRCDLALEIKLWLIENRQNIDFNHYASTIVAKAIYSSLRDAIPILINFIMDLLDSANTRNSIMIGSFIAQNCNKVSEAQGLAGLGSAVIRSIQSKFTTREKRVAADIALRSMPPYQANLSMNDDISDFSDDVLVHIYGDKRIAHKKISSIQFGSKKLNNQPYFINSLDFLIQSCFEVGWKKGTLPKEILESKSNINKQYTYDTTKPDAIIRGVNEYIACNISNLTESWNGQLYALNNIYNNGIRCLDFNVHGQWMDHMILRCKETMKITVEQDPNLYALWNLIVSDQSAMATPLNIIKSPILKRDNLYSVLVQSLGSSRSRSINLTDNNSLDVPVIGLGETSVPCAKHWVFKDNNIIKKYDNHFFDIRNNDIEENIIKSGNIEIINNFLTQVDFHSSLTTSLENVTIKTDKGYIQDIPDPIHKPINQEYEALDLKKLNLDLSCFTDLLAKKLIYTPQVLLIYNYLWKQLLNSNGKEKDELFNKISTISKRILMTKGLGYGAETFNILRNVKKGEKGQILGSGWFGHKECNRRIVNLELRSLLSKVGGFSTFSPRYRLHGPSCSLLTSDCSIVPGDSIDSKNLIKSQTIGMSKHRLELETVLRVLYSRAQNCLIYIQKLFHSIAKSEINVIFDLIADVVNINISYQTTRSGSLTYDIKEKIFEKMSTLVNQQLEINNSDISSSELVNKINKIFTNNPSSPASANLLSTFFNNQNKDERDDIFPISASSTILCIASIFANIAYKAQNIQDLN